MEGYGISERVMSAFRSAGHHEESEDPLRVTAIFTRAEWVSLPLTTRDWCWLVHEDIKWAGQHHKAITMTHNPGSGYWENTKRDGVDPWKGKVLVGSGMPPPWGKPEAP